MTDTGSQTWVIAFDADDTLWHWERVFVPIYQRLLDFENGQVLIKILLERERSNLAQYGYGANAFLLSLIEALLQWGAASPQIHQELNYARHRLYEASLKIELLDGVLEVLTRLSPHHRLVIVSRGDELEQSRKIASSGIKDHFSEIIIVPHKSISEYRNILRRLRIEPSGFIMVGNSIAADIRPVLDIGAIAVWIPYAPEWHAETAPIPQCSPRFHTINSIAELPELLIPFSVV